MRTTITDVLIGREWENATEILATCEFTVRKAAASVMHKVQCNYTISDKLYLSG